MSEDRPSDYKVGYGRPPLESRFQTGRSGNPKGRPKKAKPIRDPVVDNYISDLILAEAARPVAIIENGASVEIPMAQALVRSLNVAGVKGDRHAALQSVRMIKQVQDRTLEGRTLFYQATVKQLAEARQHMERAADMGLPEPDFTVHPDDVQVDHDTHKVRINGPASRDERRLWDEMRNRAAGFEESRERLVASRGAHPEAATEIDRELEQIDLIQRQTDSLFPDEQTRRRPGFDLQVHRQQTAQAFNKKRRKPAARPRV